MALQKKSRVRKRSRRVVVTAAHCLPNLPPAHASSYTEDRTYPKLLSSLDGAKKDIWAECMFVNPVADIAVLGKPDDQVVPDEADAYDALAENAPVFKIGT